MCTTAVDMKKDQAPLEVSEKAAFNVNVPAARPDSTGSYTPLQPK